MYAILANQFSYPHKFHVNTRVPDFVTKYEHLKKGELQEDVDISVGLRIMTIRTSGNNLRFYVCKGEGVTIQVFCDSRYAKDGNWKIHDILHRGDWIGGK